MTSIDCLIAFRDIDWTAPAPGLRVKEVVRGGHRLRVLEIGAAFEEADWCTKGHVGFVVEGELDIDFDGRSIHLRAGDALCIPPGEATKHKARVAQGTATLFVVETAGASCDESPR